MRYKKNYSQVVGEGLDPLSKKKNGRFQIPIIIPIPNKYLSAHAQQKGFLGEKKLLGVRSPWVHDYLPIYFGGVLSRH